MICQGDKLKWVSIYATIFVCLWALYIQEMSDQNVHKRKLTDLLFLARISEIQTSNFSPSHKTLLSLKIYKSWSDSLHHPEVPAGAFSLIDTLFVFIASLRCLFPSPVFSTRATVTDWALDAEWQLFFPLCFMCHTWTCTQAQADCIMLHKCISAVNHGRNSL